MFWCFRGYERPMWFTVDGEKANMNIATIIKLVPFNEYETNNTIKNVGLFDLTHFLNLK